MFKEELPPINHKFFKKMKREHFPIHSIRPVYPNTKIKQRHHKERKLQTDIHYECRCKLFNKIHTNQIQKHVKKGLYTMTNRIDPRNASWIQHMKINVIDPTKTKKNTS